MELAKLQRGALRAPQAAALAVVLATGFAEPEHTGFHTRSVRPWAREARTRRQKRGGQAWASAHLPDTETGASAGREDPAAQSVGRSRHSGELWWHPAGSLAQAWRPMNASFI